MASSFDKIQADIDSLRRRLSEVGKDQQSAFDKAAKSFDNLSKSADEFGKTMQDSIDPANYISKWAASAAEKYEKIRQEGLKHEQIQKESLNTAKFYGSQINDIRAQEAKIQADKLAGKPYDAAKLKQLQDQRAVLTDQVKNYINISLEAKKNANQQEELLAKAQRELQIRQLILSAYQTLMSLGEKYDKMLSEEAKAQGTSKDEINAQYNAIQKINNDLGTNLASNQEILKAVTAVRKEYALTQSQLANIGKEAANISRFTGLSVDEAVKFQNSLAEIGGTSHTAQENMTAVAHYAAQAAGVPIGMVMKDVANTSSAVRTIFRGNTTELIKQAAEARKLGSSLDSAGKSAEALLNFETSIGAELKAAALLGQNLNFNESRRLAFAGDLIGSEKALQKEIERVGDLNKLNYNQRKALAEVTGKDFSELQKMQTQRKDMLEAEKLFPEEAAKMRKAQEELNALQKKGPEARKKELELLMQQKTAEAESAKLAQAKEQALLNLGKVFKPLYDIIMFLQVGFFKFLGLITNFENYWAKLGVSVVAGGLLLFGAFKLIKGGLSSLLELGAKGLEKFGESMGKGVGSGLKAMGGGIRSMSNAINGISPAQIVKMAAILGILTLSVMGLAKAFSMLANVSGEQIMSFTAAIVILGVSLAALGAIMLIPGIQVGVLAFASALGIVSLAAMGFAIAIKIVTSSMATVADIMTNLGKTVDTMIESFRALPAVIGGVAGPLIKLALVSPLLFAAALGVGALTYSLGALGVALLLFPTRELTRVTNQLALLSISAAGIRAAVSSLKELGDIKLPKIELGNVAALAAVSTIGSAAKSQETQELKQGLEVVAQKIEVLTNLMATGGIAVNLDGQKVNYALAKSSNNRGSLGQATF